MALRHLAVALLLAGCARDAVLPRSQETVAFAVLPHQVLRSHADRVVGINLNYIRDDDANRPPGARPLAVALGDMGASWLRYPGGEKSDFIDWGADGAGRFGPPRSLGPYAGFRGRRLDFDRFMALARAVGAEPMVVVGWANPAAGGPGLEAQVRQAARWVRYANRVRGYGVRYWEIGNENWHRGTARPAEMAAVVAAFSRAMRAEDPAIRLGSSGSGPRWWAAFLPAAAAHLDFVTVSLYNAWGWKSYARWLRQPEPDLVAAIREAREAVTRHAGGRRLPVLVAETNSKDYSPGGWPGRNNLGHALVTFDTLGQLLADPGVPAALLWGTRWMRDSEARRDQFYALDSRNQLLPSGRALALWGRFLQRDLLAVRGGTRHLSARASASADRRRLAVWLLNRGPRPVSTLVQLPSAPGWRVVDGGILHGRGPDDSSPVWSSVEPGGLRGDQLRVDLPPFSVTVVQLVR